MTWKVNGFPTTSGTTTTTVEPGTLSLDQAVRAQLANRLHALPKRHIVGRDLPVYSLRFTFIGPSPARLNLLNFFRDLMKSLSSWTLEAPAAPNEVYFNNGSKTVILSLISLRTIHAEGVGADALEIVAAEVDPADVSCDDQGFVPANPLLFCLIVNGQMIDIGEDLLIADGRVIQDQIPISDNLAEADGQVIHDDVPIHEQLNIDGNVTVAPVTKDTGTETETTPSKIAAVATVPVGTETDTAALKGAVGSGVKALGTESESMLFAGALTSAQGTKSAAFAAGSHIVGVGYAGTVTQTRNSGSTSWQNPGQAQGIEDSIPATIASATLLPTTYDADLKAKDFHLPASKPSGFTRTKVEVIINHQWDNEVSSLIGPSEVHTKLTIRDKFDGLLQTVFDRSSGIQATFLEETFDITTAVAGQSDNDLSQLHVRCEATGSLGILGGASFWNVDAIYIRITWDKASLP